MHMLSHKGHTLYVHRYNYIAIVEIHLLYIYSLAKPYIKLTSSKCKCDIDPHALLQLGLYPDIALTTEPQFLQGGLIP